MKMKNKDLQGVFKKGRGFFGRFLGIKVLKNNLAESRFGFIVNLKVSKKAIVRNKIKRRLREITKLAEVKPGYDVVAIVKPEIVDKDFGEMKKELERLLKNAKIINLKND